MPAYLDILLPIGISVEWSGGPSHDTDVVQMASGKEARNQNWSGNLGKWAIRYNHQTNEAWEKVLAFIQVTHGMAHSFRMRDPLGFIATTARGKFTTIDGQLQMVLRYTFGAYTFDKIITKPDPTCVLEGGGTFDAATGRVTSGTPTAWSGLYYRHVRFGVDDIQATGVDRTPSGDYVLRYDDVPLIEVLDDDEGE